MPHAITLRVLDGRPDLHAVVVGGGDEPLVFHTPAHDLACGRCRSVLARSGRLAALGRLVLACPRCGAYNTAYGMPEGPAPA